VAGAGFERREVSEFVTAAKAEQARLDLEGHAGRVVVRPVAITLDRKARPQERAEAGARQGELGRQAQYADHQRTADGRRAEVLKASVTSEDRSGGHCEAAEVSRTTPSSFSRRLPSWASASRCRSWPCACRASCSCSMTQRCWSIRGTLSTYDAAPTADDITTWAPA
jgi:type III restriction enzyme